MRIREDITAIVCLLAASVPCSAQSWRRNASTLPPTLQDGRQGGAMVENQQTQTLDFFGGLGTVPHQETYEFDGAWTDVTQPFPAQKPPARYGHAMAFDLFRSQVVLFGGWDGTTPNAQTWILSGTAWTAGPPAPPGMVARAYHVMVYDLFQTGTVLFGGWRPAGYLNDAWVFDGSAWTAMPAVPAGLTPRGYAAAANDIANLRIVLYGGRDAAQTFSETWLLGSAGWSQGAGGPAPRHSHAVAYEPLSQRIFLFGGSDGTSLSAETWVYDGNWTVSSAAPTPGLVPREGAVLASDPIRRLMVLFGGSDGTSVLNDTWELLPFQDLVAGSGLAASNPNRVRVFDSSNCGTATVDFLAYGAGQWGTNVSTGDVDANRDDILTGPGPGAVYGPHVRAWNRTGAPLAKVSFYAYGTLKYGANVAGLRIDTDAFDEIVTGAGPGTVFGPHVRAFNVDAGSVAAISKVNFFAYGTLQYGANVAGGDVERDGFEELLTGPGPGPSFSPTVRGFNYDGTQLTAIAKINFNAQATPGYGTLVAAGDVDADAYAEIVTIPGGGCDVPIFDYDGATVQPAYTVAPFPGGTGCHCGVGDVGGNGQDDVLVGQGSTSGGSDIAMIEGGVAIPCSPIVAFPGQLGATAAAGDLDP